jgi:hypothetical protein
MKSFIICNPHPIIFGDKIKKSEIGGVCSRKGSEGKCSYKRVLVEKHERDPWKTCVETGKKY